MDTIENGRASAFDCKSLAVQFPKSSSEIYLHHITNLLTAASFRTWRDLQTVIVKGPTFNVFQKLPFLKICQPH